MEDKLREDLKKAQLDRDEVKVSTLRLLLAEVTNLKIQKNAELTDADIISVVQKAIKQRRESIESFKKGSRDDLAAKEEAELKILQNYLPEQLSDEELTSIVRASITEIGATSNKDMGKVVGMVMGKVGQKAQGSRVSAIVSENLIK